MTSRDAAIEAAARALWATGGTDWHEANADERHYHRDCAEAALDAALAVLQPIIPNTAEALDALPVGTVIRSDEGAVARWRASITPPPSTPTEKAKKEPTMTDHIEAARGRLGGLHDHLSRREVALAADDLHAILSAILDHLQQSEAAPDPLDESNHADRIDGDGDQWVWCDECDGFRMSTRHKHGPGLSVATIDDLCGPLTFAPRLQAVITELKAN